MTFVNITALTFPDGAQAEIERRFAARARRVDGFEGFEGFELLRPVAGEDRYFVVTRWSTREHYEAWRASRADGGHEDDVRRGMSVAPMGFEVVQHEEP
ncbi:MAG: antibiotic biosynthesis monooxygenase [Actinomyces sp.]|uniref:antibiotic biosynthesis monooxygenase family protein n=1 Tax=Actinomyces sp. TaxID=29317 RepID=UPI0026DB72EE|nr:antibiotic biosynthesis monooxygenase [Actinomyces sp.]MDO4243378.1 antibiotic biosynthesis monooxygenase [Actinomyces sp.]